jgi:hypothetical protein
MHATPGAVRFARLQALLKYEGFEVVNKRGSHSAPRQTPQDNQTEETHDGD